MRPSILYLVFFVFVFKIPSVIKFVQFSNEILTHCPSIRRCRPARTENHRNLEHIFSFYQKNVPGVASDKLNNPHMVCILCGGFILGSNSFIGHNEELNRIWHHPVIWVGTLVNNMIFLENEAFKWKTVQRIRGKVPTGVPYRI